jgi:hypothetical protein
VLDQDAPATPQQSPCGEDVVIANKDAFHSRAGGDVEGDVTEAPRPE